MRKSARRTRYRLFSRRQWQTRLLFWSGAIMVGALAALFALASEWANHQFKQMHADTPWLPFVLTPLGLMSIAWLTRRVFPGSQGSGIPQAIAALNLELHGWRRQLLSLRIVVGKILLATLGILCGASIGREGPTVHVGASVMYALGGRGRFRRIEQDKGLILAGSAAGIAAAFNTPLAGIMFAIEEMGRSFHERTNGVLLAAVVFAGVTAMAILGNYTYFGRSSATLALQYWYVVPVCGVVGGLLGGLFSLGLIQGSRRLRPYALAHPFRLAALCGLVVASIGFLSGGSSFGTGYAEARAIIHDPGAGTLLYPLYKFGATLASYFSGIPGGIFAPSLATGAGVGADLAHLFPADAAAAVVMLGMVGYFTGVVQTPLTAFIIVMEMTDSHDMILPLIATAFIASTISKLICHRPIYRAMADMFLDALAEREGRNDTRLQKPQRES